MVKLELKSKWITWLWLNNLNLWNLVMIPLLDWKNFLNVWRDSECYVWSTCLSQGWDFSIKLSVLLNFNWISECLLWLKLIFWVYVMTLNNLSYTAVWNSCRSQWWSLSFSPNESLDFDWIIWIFGFFLWFYW